VTKAMSVSSCRRMSPLRWTRSVRWVPSLRPLRRFSVDTIWSDYWTTGWA
jgi:hypothetical protein